MANRQHYGARRQQERSKYLGVQNICCPTCKEWVSKFGPHKHVYAKYMFEIWTQQIHSGNALRNDTSVYSEIWILHSGIS